MKYLIWALIVAFALTLLPTHSTAAANPNRLVGTRWKLLAFGAENAPSAPIGQQSITLNLGADAIGGSGGCNTYGGNYTVNGETISFKEIFSTLIACEPLAITQQEQAYFQALGAATRFRFEDGLLIISYGNGEVLIFTRLIDLVDSQWRLINYSAPSAEIALPDSPAITLSLTADRASGSGGCNSYTAALTYAEDRLSFGQIASTEMACDEPIMTMETTYFEALAKVGRYQIVDGQLVLLSDDGQRLTFVRLPTFTESAWRLVTYGAPNNQIAVAEAEITLSFAEGRAAGSGGCNQYSAPFTVAGDSLSFGTVVSTRRACLSTALSQQEQAYFRALETVLYYTQTGDSLMLHYADNQTLVFKRANAE